MVNGKGREFGSKVYIALVELTGNSQKVVVVANRDLEQVVAIAEH